MSGYFAIGIYQPKKEVNIGTLWRTAYLLGAQYIFTIGQRYKSQCSDTSKTPRHVPLFEFSSWEQFKCSRPRECRLVGVELVQDALLLDTFCHPERAIYVLGAEDYGIPHGLLTECDFLVKLRGERSMNVSTAGSIVMYHRGLK